MNTIDRGLDSARVALRIGLGLAAFLAGLDKFFYLLADWSAYVSPLAKAALPVDPTTFLYVAGVIEMVVGIGILTRWTRIASYAAMVWLAVIALELVTTGRFFDVAVRDVEMAIAAYTLARLTEAHEAAAVLRPATTRAASRAA